MKKNIFTITVVFLFCSLLLFASCQKEPNPASDSSAPSSELSTQAESSAPVPSESPAPVNTEGSVTSLFATCLPIDAQCRSYEQAVNDPRVGSRIPREKQIGPYPITLTAYMEKSDAFVFFAEDVSIDDGMAHEKIVGEFVPLSENVNAQELIQKYPTLAYLQENGLTNALIEKCGYSVFEDGYAIEFINDDNLCRILVNGDRELLKETIDLL